MKSTQRPNRSSLRVVQLLIATWVLLPFSIIAQVPQEAFTLQDGDRVVLVGDTLIEREGTSGYIEHTLTRAFPNRQATFRNLGWSADVPTGQSRASFGWSQGERHWRTNLLGQILATQPSVVVLGYGMAASFDGPAGLASFTSELDQLMTRITEGGRSVRFILLGPIPHEDLGAPLPDPTAHNLNLARYNDAIRQLALKRGARFVNLFEEVAAVAKLNPATKLTQNGIHLTESGYRVVGNIVAKGLGITLEPPTVTLSGTTPGTQSAAQLSDIAATPSGLSFTVREDRIGSLSQKTEPFSDLSGIKVKVDGLRGSAYSLKVDGVEVDVASGTAWSEGRLIQDGPAASQAEALRQAILRKNEHFFNRWRPENSTYLFLFRKGEQGQNAREIPQFDPLIAQEEQEIATLRQPKPHRFELTEVSPGHTPAKSPTVAKSSSVKIDPTPQPTPSFDLAPELEIQLYAENPQLYKPIHMNFDAKGRLWVASSSVYPQIKPGQKAEDSIIVLEDTDHDGKADRSTIFAEGLLIPTGVEPGDGGVYVGQSTELLHFKDLDGDGRADVRKTVLSGFGTEDTHHILHTLHWGMDGQLYMNQSIYIHTHTETPTGVVRLNSGGILNLRPDTLELGIHMKGLVNTWGHQFDLYGQSFATDGAGGDGINYVVPQAMYTTYAGARRTLGGVSPGSYPKFCSLEILYSPQFPEDWQGNMITCDFRAHRVVRFSIAEQGSAYVTKEMPDLIRSKDANFRPIDIKLGPDGALYIADWSNPIIQHGEVDFRDPRRDKEHGRIWRVSRKGGTVLPSVDLQQASTESLFGHLMGASGFHREKARRVLTERGTSILPDLKSWVQSQKEERGLLEALWLYQSLDVVEPQLLEQLLTAKDGRVRAAAVRVLSFWKHRITPTTLTANARLDRFTPPAGGWDKPLALLADRVVDEHPRVRMEALRALAKFPTARAAELALSAVDKPFDPHLEYAAWLTINDLAEPWLAAVQSGAWKIQGREKQLEYALRSIQPAQAGAVLSQILKSHPIDREGSGIWIELIGQSGTPSDLRGLLDQALKGGFADAATDRALKALDQAARLRKARPEGAIGDLSPLLASSSEAVRASTVRLSGAWGAEGLKLSDISGLAGNASASPALRSAAFAALRDIGGARAIEILQPLCAATSPLAVRKQAVVALSALKPEAAAEASVRTLLELTTEAEALELWRPLLASKGNSTLITKALPKSGIPPAVAKAGMRVTRESGKSDADLILALTRGADLAEGEASLSDAELKQMAAEVLRQGNAEHGEEVYRRAQLACVSCHSIGGAGGKVGPDMTSIGASAPVDYLIESVWFPNRKVKEGFNSVMLETKDGQELSGILVRENNESITLRNTQGGETTVAKNNLERRANGGSLMPAGLIDGLPVADRLDLFRFLSELGKPGPFDASKGTVARGWKLRPGHHEDEQFGLEKAISRPLTAGGWTTTWSLVDGRLQNSELQQAAQVQRYVGLVAVYAATQLQVPQAGTVHLDLEGTENASIWVGGKSVKNAPKTTIDLPAGTHTVLVRLDPRMLPKHLRIGSSDGTFVMP